MAEVTFLQLSPEFGGTRFGPFHGVEIRLGSDPEVNDISLPADLGVAPQHLKVLQQNDKTYIIAPVDRTTTVYIWRKNSNKPKQVVTPIAVTPGDSFSLVVPEGARFTIELATLRQQRERADDNFAEKAIKRMPTSGRMFKEIKRRGFAAVFATRLGNVFMNVSRFVTTGQIFSPVYIIGGLMMVSGWFMSGGVGCGMLSLNAKKNALADRLVTCRDRSAVGPLNVDTVPTLTQAILQDTEWTDTLMDDRPLAMKYAELLVDKFNRRDSYKWAYRDKSNKFAAFDRGIEDMPSTLRSTLSYLAAPPRKTGYREWSVILDSEGEQVCGRGPLRLTYRQAVRLGLQNIQVDRLVSRSIANSQDDVQKRQVLLETTEFEGLEDPPSLSGAVIADAGGAMLQGGQECMHVEGDDDRNNIGVLAKALALTVGPAASGVPPEGGKYWVGHRLARLAAMDFAYDYDKLDFTRTNQGPIGNLQAQGVTEERTKFATRYIAEVMSDAVAARCGAILDKERIHDPPKHMGTLPELDDCALINAFVDYGRL